MQRYSLLYARSESAVHDDKKMRARLGALFKRLFDINKSEAFAAFFLEEVGEEISQFNGFGFHIDWNVLSSNIDLEDLLDLISVYAVYHRLSGDMLIKFVQSIERIFRERNVAYRIDESAIVHPYVDRSFQAVQEDVIRGLVSQKNSAAVEHLKAVDQAMLGENADWREAVRRTFDAAENVFKQMFAGKTQLATKTVKDALEPELLRLYGQDSTAMNFARKQLAAFVSWIEAAHFYRHEPGQSEAAMPPSDLAISFIAQGFAHIRWLSDISSRPSD